MAETTITHSAKTQLTEAPDEEYENLTQECKNLLLSLPKQRGWSSPYCYLYQGFWYPAILVQAITSFQKHFQARHNDIVVATLPKSGTTWLKALTFTILNRKRFNPSQQNHPLLTTSPHYLVPFFEVNLYGNNGIPDLSSFSDPRLFSTHIPFSSLPDSIKTSKCKIIYICRNPFDNFVSLWIFLNTLVPPSLPKLTREEAFERYLEGIHGYGPFWTHMLGYWKESRERPNNVLFLKYEDLKGDIGFQLRRVAKFLGCPFSSEEESDGVIESIIDLCSFDKMKELEVNKTGKLFDKYENKNLFRKGEIGDWVNHFSPEMTEKLGKIIEEKLGVSGLSF